MAFGGNFGSGMNIANVGLGVAASVMTVPVHTTSNALLQPRHGVQGFDAGTVERQIVIGLPDGVYVPAEALETIAALKQLDVWIMQGQRVQAWAADLGVDDAEWVDEDTEKLRLPPELAGNEVPGFVTAWLAEAPEIEALVHLLFP